jgi:hypothetical protein
LVNLNFRKIIFASALEVLLEVTRGTTPNAKHHLLSAALTLAILWIAGSAGAIPRYSARYQQNCSLCHVNPTGGGLRNLYASQYLVPAELTLKNTGDASLGRIDPQIGENVTIGTDLRMVHFYSDEDAAAKNFFQMQGDLYFAFELDRIAAYLDKGISSSYELFGLAHVLPGQGYVKVGRFIPAFGWKFADHTTFTREYVGFFPPSHTDVGLEVGFHPGRFTVELAAVNGNRGSTLDNNRDLAFVGRGVYRFAVSSVGMGLGASAAHNNRPGRVVQAGGAFGYIGVNRFTWLWEADALRDDPTGAERQDAFVSSHELAFVVTRGLDIIATYDFHDPDIDRQTGARSRFGGGIAVFAGSLFLTEFLVRYYLIDEGDDVVGPDYVETALQFHFLY